MSGRTLSKRSQGTSRRRAFVESLETRVLLTAVYEPIFGTESQKQDDDAKLKNPEIFLIFWGSYWQGTDSPQAVAVENAAKLVADSTFARITAQYGAGPNISIDPRYTWDSGDPTNPADAGDTFESGKIDDVIQNQIDNGPLPESDDDSLANTPIYVVVTPPGARSDTPDAIGFNTTGSDFDLPFDFDTIPECWVGTSDDGSGGVFVDGFSQTFSHEIAECMTDEGGGGFKVNKPAAWNGKGDDQIGDREGNAYYFRMYNGVTVQPVWSRADQAWVVDDGADQVWNFHPNWSGDNFNGNFDLTINGDQNANKDDYVVIDTLPNGGFLVYMDGEELHLDGNGYINKLTVNTGAGNNIVEVRGSPMNVQTTIDGAGGTLTVQGPNANTVWFISGANAGSINNVRFQNVTNLSGGTEADSYAFNNAASIAGTIDGHDGHNSLSYNGVTAMPVTVNLEDKTATNLGHFEHIVQVLGSQSPQPDTLIGDGLWTISGVNSGSVGNVDFSIFENLTGGVLADTFQFMAAGRIFGNVDGGGGYNTLDYSLLPTPNSIFVDFTDHLTSQVSGHFSNILNAVGSVGGFDALAAPEATWDIDHLNSGSTPDFDFSDFERLTGGPGDDRFVFHPGGSISASIDGGGGVNTLDYSDLAGPITVDFTLGTASFVQSIFDINNVIGSASGNDTIVGPDALWHISGMNAGDVNGITFSSIENLTGSPDQDTFAFLPGGGISGNLDGGGGNNVVDYSALTTPVTINLGGGASTGVGGSFSNITTLIGGSGQNNIVGPTGAATWNVIGLNTVQVAGTTFTNIQAINAGAGDDTFTFSGDGKLDGLIDGGGGNNTLSYAGFTGDVVVNLRRHAATAVGGGIFSVANVTGGQRNSLLVGDGGVNILRGGGGRSILIGGLGNDALFGGAGDNILIGDATLYDDDATALQGIFNEWNRTDASFEQRVADLISAGRNGLNGAFTLDKKAVVTDNASDSLVGSAVTLDWFLADKNLDAESGVSAQDHVTQV
jgi:hypothetical protein